MGRREQAPTPQAGRAHLVEVEGAVTGHLTDRPWFSAAGGEGLGSTMEMESLSAILVHTEALRLSSQNRAISKPPLPRPTARSWEEGRLTFALF